jgi:hypothetical protein
MGGGDHFFLAFPMRAKPRTLRSPDCQSERRGLLFGLSVVRDFETGGGLNQERVWRIMVDVTRLVCGEATDGFG